MTSRVLSATAGPPAPDEREALKLPERSEVVRLERLRMHRDEAYIYSVDVMPRSYFPADLGEVDWAGSLLDFLDSVAPGPRIRSRRSAPSTCPPASPPSMTSRREFPGC